VPSWFGIAHDWQVGQTLAQHTDSMQFPLWQSPSTLHAVPVLAPPVPVLLVLPAPTPALAVLLPPTPALALALVVVLIDVLVLIDVPVLLAPPCAVLLVPLPPCPVLLVLAGAPPLPPAPSHVSSSPQSDERW